MKSENFRKIYIAVDDDDDDNNNNRWLWYVR
jgi:hypothetical protein